MVPTTLSELNRLIKFKLPIRNCQSSSLVNVFSAIT